MDKRGVLGTEYSVSEAVQQTGVPSHVLRYWEEELQLTIRRTSQGHRVYSEADLELFRRVKELKDKGIQLKAIRVLLEENQRTQGKQNVQEMQNMQEAEARELTERIRQIERAGEAMDSERGETECEEMHADRDTVDMRKETYEVIPTSGSDNLRQFELILKRMMEEVVEEQNEKLEQAIADLIHDEAQELYLRYCDAVQEAAAEGRRMGSGGGRQGILAKLFGRK